MHVVAFIVGVGLLLVTFVDAFETILLPRRINRRIRYSKFYYRTAWRLWRAGAGMVPDGKLRETLLSGFGPSSMLGLFASWLISLVLAFGILHWAIKSIVASGDAHFVGSFATDLYLSGSTFFTLGLGDVAPVGGLSRTLAVTESGLGLGFLAIIISYLPVLYQAFSKRELRISLLDARAGSPPSGGEYLARLALGPGIAGAGGVLHEWEEWAAELLESQLSFPVLAYYRSQHANQSWLAALATMLDAAALLLAYFPDRDSYQAQLTFAMARHASVDIALIFGIRPRNSSPDRLTEDDRRRLLERFSRVGLRPVESSATQGRLSELRGLYEPFLEALAAHFMLSLPPMFARDLSADNWQRSAWMPRSPGIGSLPADKISSDHFDGV